MSPCDHPVYTGETASGDDIILCARCHPDLLRAEKRHEWAEEDRQAYWDELAELRARRDDGITDGADTW